MMLGMRNMGSIFRLRRNKGEGAVIPVNKNILNEYRLRVNEKNLNVYGIVIKQDGKQLEHRFRSDDKVNVYSASKPVTALAIGMLIDESRLTLADNLGQLFPEYAKWMAEGTEGITVRNLLHMASGKLEFFDDFRSKNQDNIKVFMQHPLEADPGEKFFYSNGCTYMLSRIVEKISGETLRDFLIPRFFDVLGIENPQWFSCHHGHTMGATGLFLTTEELSRIGEVFLQEGTYNETRIVSAEFIKKCYTDTILTGDDKTLGNWSHYGFQVWLGEVSGTYRLDGKYSQHAIIFPEEKATVTITAHEEFKGHEIVSGVYEEILPYLKDKSCYCDNQ